MSVIKMLLDEFKKDMLQKFIEHDNKWGENSVTNEKWAGDLALSADDLRKEIHYHYAKWLYRGVEKKTMLEEDTLVNLANMIFLLWHKIKTEDDAAPKQRLL
jgi:hypothetical protein